MTTLTALTLALSALMLFGGLTVVLTREVMRLVLALGGMLIALAAIFGVLGASFVAVAEIFVYVGGVLVLFLFAIMLVHRSRTARPELASRHDLLSAVIAIGAFLLIVTTFRPAISALSMGSTPETIVPSMKALGRVLTGPMLPHLEVAGFLLLAALVSVIAVMGGERE